MKIYTKTGDDGNTSLYGGTKISKSDLRIEAYGNVDELNSYIGWLGDQPINISRKTLLKEIQDTLFIIGASLALAPSKEKKLVEKDIGVHTLEHSIDQMQELIPPLKNFILPGGNSTVSFTHIARCVCRRAERSAVRLHQQESIEIIIIMYLNRLSDYLFVLSRKIAYELNVDEVIWKPDNTSI